MLVFRPNGRDRTLIFRLLPSALLFLSVVFVCSVKEGEAQQRFRYMDDAGSFYWTDSISQVPKKYQSQLRKPRAEEIAGEAPWWAKPLREYQREIPLKSQRRLSSGGLRRVWRPRIRSYSGL